MKLSSWLDALRSGRPRRPIRRNEPRGGPRRSAVGKLGIEDLEARLVPAFLAPVDYSTGSYPIAAISADFDGDGNDDVAVANYYSGTVSVRLGTGTGTFGDAVDSTTGNYPMSLAVGDFNNDSIPDLATRNYYDITVLLGDGNGAFAASSTINLGTNPGSVAVGDFNEDNQLDIATTTNHFVVDYWGYYGYYGHWEGDAHVLLGNGSGSFAGPVSTGLGYGYYGGGAAGDFNNDGNDDFATTDGSSIVAVLLANADGSLQAPTSYGTGWGPSSVAIGDVDGDNIADLVTGNSGSVSVLMGNGAGTFQPAITSPVGPYNSSVAMGDFNADGKLDLGVGSNFYVIDGWGYYGSYGHWEGEAQVLLGYENGHFTDPMHSPLGPGWANAAASGDFDGDGFTDLALTDTGVYVMSVLVNDGVWDPLPPPSLRINDVSITEGNTGTQAATFTVSLAFEHTSDVTVHWTTANGTATAGSDYTGASGDVVIHAGDTTATIPVSVAGDRLAESTEWFFVNLTSSDAPLADSQGVGYIIDDEPRIWISDAYVTEGNSGSTNAEYTVWLSAPYDQDVTVHYATANGTATAGSDFTGVADATVTVPAGQPSATFNVAVLGDRVGEPDEYYYVNLSGATNAEIVDTQAFGSIADNEPRIWISDVARSEGTPHGNPKKGSTTEFVFTISLSAAYDQDVTINYSTADGTARVSNSDYQAKSGTATIRAGQTSTTVTVLVNQDKTREPDEWFALNLTSSSTNAFMLDNQGIGWILDDDTHGRH